MFTKIIIPANRDNQSAIAFHKFFILFIEKHSLRWSFSFKISSHALLFIIAKN